MYKIIHQIVDLNLSISLLTVQLHVSEVTIISSKCHSCKFSFFLLSVSIILWNKLPNEAVSATTINVFANVIMQQM